MNVSFKKDELWRILELCYAEDVACYIHDSMDVQYCSDCLFFPKCELMAIENKIARAFYKENKERKDNETQDLFD